MDMKDIECKGANRIKLRLGYSGGL